MSAKEEDDISIQFEDSFNPNSLSEATGKISPEPLSQPLLNKKATDEAQPPFWSLDYYSFLFNVDTKEVLYRLVRSFLPIPPTFLELIKNNPDMYGPFWIASTLVFSITFSSHIAGYLISGQTFNYDVGKLSFAAAAIYGYLAFIPILLSFILRYYKIEVKLLQILCIYGYSFFVYIPVSILCVIPSLLLRWIFIGVAFLISTLFLISNFYTLLKEIGEQTEEGTGKKFTKRFTILSLMAICNLGFALICQFYFFL